MKNTSIKYAFFIGFLAILFTCGAAFANAATWTVTKFTNSNDNVCDADCSLREAVFNADSGDTVVFDSNLFGQTFTLGGSEIVITRRITIDGQLNPSVAFITGDDTSRIFLIEAGGALDLRNAALQSGNSATSTFDAGRGSAISAKANASLSLNRVWVRNNTAVVSAIVVRTGTHHITNSSFTTNTASTCTAIYNQDLDANLFMANVTVTDNFDPGGDLQGSGALCNSGNLTIRNSTITENSAEVNGGGIFNATGGVLNLGNTIVAQNTAPGNAQDIVNFNSTVISAGGNLIGDTDGTPPGTFTQPNDITGVNPLLAPTNSGQGGFPVVSHPLQAGSPARNGGLNANAVDPLTNAPLTTDTRGTGFPRITDTTVDIGAFEDQSGNTSLIVTKEANSNDLVCDTDCSLREAVYQASLNFGTDTITFAHNAFGIIPLGGSEIVIQNQNVIIIGTPSPNANYRIISGENTNRIFRLNNATVHISGLSLANGHANGGGFGGAILAENNSNLTLDKVIVRNNFATAYGAAHLSGGTHRIINSTINNNSANTGLALSVSGTLNMANTTVSGNLDADGGTGIGAIYVTGTANIRNSTIAFNRTSGGTGGGVFVAGTLNIGNSIVANNIAAISPDIERSSGVITSVGGNLVQNTSGFPAGTFNQTNDQTGVDPLVGTLGDNGGNVTTHALMPNSPAINSGINAVGVDPFDNSALLTDARGAGFQRILSSVVDKGAFESAGPTAAHVSVGGRVTVNGSGLRNARVVLTDQNGGTRKVLTSSFGYYKFDDVEVGQTYIVDVASKRYRFNPQVVVVMDELTNLDFTGIE